MIVGRPKQLGETNVKVRLYCFALSDGAPFTFQHDTANLELWYHRDGGVEVEIGNHPDDFEEVADLDDAHIDNGICPYTNIPGLVQVHLPDAVCAAAGAPESVVIGGKIGSTHVIRPLEIPLSADNLYVADEVAYKKNVAVTAFMFYLELADGSPGTSLTVAATISKDGGSFASVAGAVTEVSAGWYKHNLSQAEMNADEIALKYTATGAKQRNIKVRTQP